MAFNAAPTQVVASWSEDGTNVTFPIASVPELSAAEADASTGDLRKVWFALLTQLNAWWIATAAADRPARMTVSKLTTSDTALSNSEGVAINSVRFNIEFKVVESAGEVNDE